MEQIPFSLYKPSERFETLAELKLASDMWHCLTSESSMNAMLEAADSGEAPVAPIDSELHEQFSHRIEQSGHDESELRILCMNMMKQLLELQGYEHVGCALRVEGEFVKSAGIFRKKS